MAKEHYRIPFDLNASHADMEIAIRTKDGIGFKPAPMKNVLAYVIGFLACFYIIMNTTMAVAPLPIKILFAVTWCLGVIMLCKQDSTQRMQASLIGPLLNYIPKRSRVVVTRSNQNAAPFYSIVGIESVDDRTGLISFFDGTFGYMYRVVGSASILLFDADRDAILDRVDAFYRKMNTDSEIIFLTIKSSQAVYKQVAALKRRYDRLRYRDPELLALAEEQFGVLKNFVGGSFKSIHQYMIIKCDNKEMLAQTKNVLRSEVENSSRMIKRCVALYGDDITDVLSSIYKGRGR